MSDTDPLAEINQRLSDLEKALSEQKMLNSLLFLMIASAKTEIDARMRQNLRYDPTLGEERIADLKKRNDDLLVESNQHYRDSFEEAKKMIWGSDDES